MGLPTCQPDFARHRFAADCRADRANPRRTWGALGRILGACLGLLLALPASGETLRVATYNIRKSGSETEAAFSGFSGKGPGTVLELLQKGGSTAQKAVIETLADLNADIVLLTGIDYDAGGQTLAALGAALAQAGVPYPYLLPLRPNSGLPTGFDLNGDGKVKGKPDAMAFGGFAGERGMAVLSRLPIDTAQMRDFTEFLWADLPQNLSPDSNPALRSVQRLSSYGHYDIPLTLADGSALHLLAFYAGSPNNYDGAEMRNAARNHDEIAFWLRMLGGDLPFPAPASQFVVIGQATLDPVDGGGNSAALKTLLAHPSLQDPLPRGTSGRRDVGQQGDSALDTVLYDRSGGLRVDYVLPSADMKVLGAGVVWPADSDPQAATLTAASRHRPVWVDISLP